MMLVPFRWKCCQCEISLSGDGASRHYLAFPSHKLEKLPPIKPNSFKVETS